MEINFREMIAQAQCDQKKSPNFNQSIPKMISIEKWSIQKLPKNVGELGKLIVTKGFKKLPKSNKSTNLITLLKPNVKRVT